MAGEAAHFTSKFWSYGSSSSYLFFFFLFFGINFLSNNFHSAARTDRYNRSKMRYTHEKSVNWAEVHLKMKVSAGFRGNEPRKEIKARSE